jgi:arginyl-tRNA synthetase
MNGVADPIALVASRIADAFAAAYGDAAREVDPAVRASDRADAQVNGALALAKRVGGSPRDAAAAVLAAARLDDLCAATEVAGPGFINLTFRDEVLAAELARSIRAPRLGVRGAPAPRTCVVDYSAPNVAKEMHVGHLRSTILGDAIVRLLEFVGHRVVRENHVGDWGTPFGMLIEHLVDVGESAAVRDLSLGDLDAFYRRARAAFDADESFKARARARVVALQSGDSETLRLWRLLVDESTRYFARVYEALDVRLEPGDVRGESAYDALLPVVLERLRAAGLLRRDDDADVVFPAGFTNRDNEPLPLIVRKRDGGWNYAATDLACVIDRTERLRASLLVYVVGAPQAQHLAMVGAVARAAGWLGDAPAGGGAPREMVHVAFGSVLGSDHKMLRSRSGDAIKLHALLDEAVERAAAAVAEKNPDLPADERAAAARAVGIGAVKYADLSGDRVKDYVFDWDRMLAFDGNTGPYLQYAHARICSIFRHSGVDRGAVRGTTPSVAHPAERALVLGLLRFDTAVWDSLGAWSPHRLCTHLHDLASAFSAFYESCPVLKADDEAVRRGRLALCDATALTLATGLDLLGIAAPERM